MVSMLSQHTKGKVNEGRTPDGVLVGLLFLWPEPVGVNTTNVCAAYGYLRFAAYAHTAW